MDVTEVTASTPAPDDDTSDTHEPAETVQELEQDSSGGHLTRNATDARGEKRRCPVRPRSVSWLLSLVVAKAANTVKRRTERKIRLKEKRREKRREKKKKQDDSPFGRVTNEGRREKEREERGKRENRK